MKKLIAVAFFTSGLAVSAQAADTKNFEGFSAGLNVNLFTMGVKVTDTRTDTYGGDPAASYSFDAAYGFKIGADKVLTVGAEYDFGKPKIYRNFYPAEPLEEDRVQEIRLKQRYGVYVAPGIAISKEALLYARLGWGQLKTESDFLYGNDALWRSLTSRGFNYGIGSKLMVSDRVFVKVEVIRHSFNSERIGLSDLKPSATMGTIGIGRNF